jgi:hypothetical protein
MNSGRGRDLELPAPAGALRNNAVRGTRDRVHSLLEAVLSQLLTVGAAQEQLAASTCPAPAR